MEILRICPSNKVQLEQIKLADLQKNVALLYFFPTVWQFWKHRTSEKKQRLGNGISWARHCRARDTDGQKTVRLDSFSWISPKLGGSIIVILYYSNDRRRPVRPTRSTDHLNPLASTLHIILIKQLYSISRHRLKELLLIGVNFSASVSPPPQPCSNSEIWSKLRK